MTALRAISAVVIAAFLAAPAMAEDPRPAELAPLGPPPIHQGQVDPRLDGGDVVGLEGFGLAQVAQEFRTRLLFLTLETTPTQ